MNRMVRMICAMVLLSLFVMACNEEDAGIQMSQIEEEIILDSTEITAETNEEEAIPLNESNEPAEAQNSDVALQGSPQWVIRVNDYDAMFGELFDGMESVNIINDNYNYAGLKISDIVMYVADNYNQYNGSVVEVIFGYEGEESIEINDLSQAMVVYRVNDGYISDPLLFKEGQLYDYSIIALHVYD